FRYGTLLNSSYVSRLSIVPTPRLHLSFFLGTWLSPNGGLAFFWPSFLLLFLAGFGGFLLQVATGRVSDHTTNSTPKGARPYAAFLIISTVLFLLTAGFSRWYTPLGGFAWGPRFMLPWIPALMLILIYFYREELSGLLCLLLKKPIGFLLS